MAFLGSAYFAMGRFEMDSVTPEINILLVLAVY